MSLTSLDLNRGSLVRTIFVLFLDVLKSLLLVFLCLTFCASRSQIQRWLTRFNIFVLTVMFVIFGHNFKISLIVFLSIFFHCLFNHCSLPYNMPRHAPIGIVWCPYDVTVSRALYPIIFTQCVNGQDLIDNELCVILWSHGLDILYCDVYITAQLEIPPGNDG